MPKTQLTPGLIALNKWLTEKGISRMTAWRWREAGILETVNIYGRLYVSPEATAAMERRAKAGEFAKKATTPHPRTRGIHA